MVTAVVVMERGGAVKLISPVIQSCSSILSCNQYEYEFVCFHMDQWNIFMSFLLLNFTNILLKITCFFGEEKCQINAWAHNNEYSGCFCSEKEQPNLNIIIKNAIKKRLESCSDEKHILTIMHSD